MVSTYQTLHIEDPEVLIDAPVDDAPAYGLNDVTKPEGQDVHFTCKLQAPTAAVSWFKGDKGENSWPTHAISHGERFTLSGNTDNTVRCGLCRD